MTSNRILTWEGCNNIRDLGGLETIDGKKTQWGAFVRGDHPSKLTEKGWSTLYEHGIRTIVSLRTHGLSDDHPIVIPANSDLDVIPVEIEDLTDADFVQQWVDTGLWCTPLYYQDALRRWPERHVAALHAIAQAQTGGVLLHCGRGYDRTGIISLLLLSLVRVSPEDILADYELSVDPEREKLLAERNTTTREVVFSTLATLDTETYLLEGGMTKADIRSIRARFLEPLN